MGSSLSVQVVAVAIEEPKLRGVCFKEFRICCLHETKLMMSEHWIVSPQSLISSKVRKARVMAHACSSCYHQTIAVYYSSRDALTQSLHYYS